MKKAIAVFVIMCVVAAFAENPHITKLIELFDVAISSPADGDVLTYSAASGKWQNSPPVVADTAKVVLRYQQENISGIFPETTLFTPSDTGLYRVNVYASNISGAVIVFASDGAAMSETFARTQTGGNATPWAEQSGIIRVAAGTPVTVTASGNESYSFYIVVEKL